jgi:hypothetical protein
VDSYKTDGDYFLLRNVIHDDTWIHHLEQEMKQLPKEWNHMTLLHNKTLKTGCSAGKMMVTVLRDIRGVI